MTDAPTQGGGGADPKPAPPPAAARPSPLRGRKRNRPNPAAGSKLATNVYDRRYPRINGNPPGRPRKSDDLKAAFLGALRRFANIGTAMDVAGISDSVVERWKREQPGGDPELGDISFAAEMARAIATPKVRGMQLLYDDAFGDPAKNIPPNVDRVQWILTRVTEEFGKRGSKLNSQEASREIREFIVGAQLSQRGVDDPNAIPRFNDDEDIEEREEREAKAPAPAPATPPSEPSGGPPPGAAAAS